MNGYREVVAEVKQAYDVVEYLRASGVDLTSAGVGKWKACCPFHNEKTPSFIVNENFQNYRCFGCGANGDLLAYVMETENYTFVEALKKLAEDKGISIQVDDDKNSVDYESLYKILNLTAAFYCKKFNDLPENHAAKKEILKRNLTFNNSDKNRIRYGYSPDGNQLCKLLQSKGFSEDLILQSGVCRKSEQNGSLYDFFRSRLMFIFTDRSGKPVGFSSRKIFEDDKRGKYVNSSDSPLFHKNRVLYNHAIARLTAGKEKNIYICEGQFDVAAFTESGMMNAVASSGTAFSREHINECNKLVGSGGELTFCFDGDEAGVKAAMKVFTTYPEIHENSYVVLFPEGKDPCDYRLGNGDEAFKSFVQKRHSMVEFIIEQTKTQFNMDSLLDRSNYVKECARVVQSISNSLLRDSAVKIIALEAFTPIDVVREAVEIAEPYRGETDYSPQTTTTGADDEDVVEEEQSFEELKKLIEDDRYYNVSARFIALGLSKQSWREAVGRSRSLLPKELHPFIDEFKNINSKSKVFPELFQDENLASYFMAREFSPFYKLMSPAELKQQFIYLHDEVEREIQRRANQNVVQQITQVLSTGEESVMMLERALLQEQRMLEERKTKMEPTVEEK